MARALMTHKSGIMEGRVVSKRTSDTQTLPLFFLSFKKVELISLPRKKVEPQYRYFEKKSETRYRYKYRYKKK